MALDIHDQFAIQSLLARYCHNADYNPPESMRAMFTPDGIFEVPAMSIRFEGIDNIIGFFTASREMTASARHIISSPVIEGEGDKANSSTYLQVLRTDDGVIGVVSIGRYIDQLVRTADGWRIKHRMVQIG